MTSRDNVCLNNAVLKRQVTLYQTSLFDPVIEENRKMKLPSAGNGTAGPPGRQFDEILLWYGGDLAQLHATKPGIESVCAYVSLVADTVRDLCFVQ